MDLRLVLLFRNHFATIFDCVIYLSVDLDRRPGVVSLHGFTINFDLEALDGVDLRLGVLLSLDLASLDVGSSKFLSNLVHRDLLLACFFKSFLDSW